MLLLKAANGPQTRQRQPSRGPHAYFSACAANVILEAAQSDMVKRRSFTIAPGADAMGPRSRHHEGLKFGPLQHVESLASYMSRCAIMLTLASRMRHTNTRPVKTVIRDAPQRTSYPPPFRKLPRRCRVRHLPQYTG